MSNDFLQRFMFENLPVKGCLVRLQESWQEVIQRAKPDSKTRELLGQSICAATLLSSSIKFKGTVGLQVQSSGSLRFLLGQCSDQRRVRGVARMNSDLTQASSPLLSEAVLSINLEPEDNGAPYQGIVSLTGESLGESLEEYFTQSEQLETRIWLVEGGNSCAGLMLQRMPGQGSLHDEFERIVHLAATLSNRELLNLSPEKMIYLLFNEDTVRLFDSEPVVFGCRCSTNKVAGVLQALGESELNSLLAERGVVEVSCEYCGKEYQFDKIDISGLLTGPLMSSGNSSGLH
jgi:molecular chaperone Hsp33